MTNVHIAVLGNEGSWYCQDLARAASARGHQFTRLDYRRLTASVGGHTSPLIAGDDDLSTVNAVIVRTMPPGSLEQVVFRMDALARLESAGAIVLNSPKSIECAVDKYLTTSRLAAAGLLVPETVVCENAEVAQEAFVRLGGDVVVKPIFGAEGRGIVRVSHPEMAHRTFRTLERLQAVLYLQRFVEHTGFDVRVLILDGRVIGGMRRYCHDDFRSNVAQNGRAEACQLSEEEVTAALTATQATEARFAGVDLLYDQEGRLFVIEVNAVPGWRAFTRVTGCDVADIVIARLEARQT